MAKPSMGPKLIHIATVDIELAGQAFSWDNNEARTVYGIDRRRGKIKRFTVPSITLDHPHARRFRE